MRSIVTAVALLICTNLGAFEIRPESLDGGAYDPLSSVSNIYFYSNNLANRCLKDKNYVRDGKGQPIHEAIIRIAYLKAYGSTIKEQTWLSPLLGAWSGMTILKNCFAKRFITVAGGTPWSSDARLLWRKKAPPS